MKKNLAILFILVVALLRIATPVSADEASDAATLAQYEKEGKISAAGVCDNMMSPMVHFKGSSYESMVMLAPISKQNVQLYVVKKTAKMEENEYFIKESLGGGKVIVRKLSAMDWSAEVMQYARNFWLYIFFPDRPHGCICQEQK